MVKEVLCVVAPQPVGDIKGSVQAKEEQVVGGDGLGLARLGDHEELRHDGHRLQEDREGPKDLGLRKNHRRLESGIETKRHTIQSNVCLPPMA